MDVTEILMAALANGNLYIAILAVVFVLGYTFITKKYGKENENYVALNTRISELEVRLAANFEADEENARNDRELLAKVEDMSAMIEDMYTPTTGKIHNMEE